MIRYLSLFSGIGAFEKALDNLGIPYELLAYCEVDKYASKAYLQNGRKLHRGYSSGTPVQADLHTRYSEH